MRALKKQIMAKQQNSNKETVQDLTSTENFLDKNKKNLLILGGAILVILIGYIGYQKLIVEPKDAESQEEIWAAYYDFENDSLAIAAAGTEDYAGLADIADSYNGTKGGDIANYAMGIISMREGNFEEALDFFESCNFEDVIIGGLCLGLQGDCHVELLNYETAANIFEKAAAREENEFTTPMFLMKAGIVYEELGEKKKANDNYRRVKEDFSKSDYAADIDKYIGRTNS